MTPHPAEAATRENGLILRLREAFALGEKVDLEMIALAETALSTHQQQGPDTPSDDVKAMVKSWPSLSRAPQPDTGPWKPMSEIPDFMDCPSHILVWNNCNGVSEIAVDPDDIYKFRYDGDGWLLWREVPEPTDVEKAAALKEPK